VAITPRIVRTPGSDVRVRRDFDLLQAQIIALAGSLTLAGLADVLITSPLNGQVLTYNTVAGKWENATGGVTSLAALTDVLLTGPTLGQVLTYDGTKWINAAIVGGSTTHYEPMTFADEVLIFNHDVVMIEVPN
jgi:hypothetical protein